MSEHGRHLSTDPAVDTGIEVVRSQERAVVTGTTPVPVARVRVAKRVVTEERTVTVRLRREELVVEELPVDAAAPGPAQSAARPDGTREELVLVLSQEEPRIETVVVPRELVHVLVDRVSTTGVAEVPLASEVVEVDTGSGPRTVG